MSHPQVEFLSAFADDELRGWRRWRVRRHLQQCPLCVVEYRQLQHVRKLVRRNLAPVAMSDTAELFWSKVRRDIERTATIVQPQSPVSAWAAWWDRQQWRVATVAAAAVVLAGWLWMSRPAQLTVQVVAAEAPLPDVVATVLPGQGNVTTVWISGLPWTADMVEMQTLFADWDT